MTANSFFRLFGSAVVGMIPLLNVALGQGILSLRTQVLTDDCPGGYQVSVADVNGDQQGDVLTLGETVRWLENGSWTAFPITGRQTRGNIDLAPRDIDGDGQIDVAVASDFRLEDPTRGKLQWLRRKQDLNQEWQLIPIADVPSIHRIRWADIEGTGHKVLVSAPILGQTARPPEIDAAGARLSFFRVPKDPVHDRWVEELIDDHLPVIHGLLVYDFDQDGREDLLTASFEGVHLFQSQGQGQNLTWKKTHLAAGEKREKGAPAAGASEIQIGRLKNGDRFLVTIEPWHGNNVVLYSKPDESGTLWNRHVLASGLDGGHALAVLDIDGDGGDEIAAGYRGQGGGVLLFSSTDATGKRWETNILDRGTLACQGMFVANLTGSGPPAFIGIGGSTHNVKLFRFDAH